MLVEIGKIRIQPKQESWYLGIVLDDQGKFVPDIKEVVDRAEKQMAALSRILSNIGAKRKKIAGIVHSTLLYGAPVGRIECYKKMLHIVQ